MAKKVQTIEETAGRWNAFQGCGCFLGILGILIVALFVANVDAFGSIFADDGAIANFGYTVGAICIFVGCVLLLVGRIGRHG